MAPYRVLALDGGGIRGVLTARILTRIEENLPGFLRHVHLFAGTSTGGLLALALAAGKAPKDLVDIYQKFADQIFADSFFDNLKDLGSLAGAEYSYEPLKTVLTQFFSDLTLAQLPRRVLVATFKLDNEGCGPQGVRTWKMKFFQNFPGFDSDGKERVVDVGIRTSAAPSYFPSYQGYIDGGVAASNPAMCALAQALDPRAGRQELRNVRLFSLGTGYNPHFLPIQNADWGLIQWAPHMLNIMMDSSQDMVDFQCRQVLGSAYMRTNPALPKEIGLGDIREIPALLETAEKVNLDATLSWIQNHFLR